MVFTDLNMHLFYNIKNIVFYERLFVTYDIWIFDRRKQTNFVKTFDSNQ